MAVMAVIIPIQLINPEFFPEMTRPVRTDKIIIPRLLIPKTMELSIINPLIYEFNAFIKK
jgi:hypothetical protein